MDTGLHDDNPVTVAGAVTYLEEDELAWHCDRINEFPVGPFWFASPVVLAFSPIGPVDAQGKQSAVNPQLIKAFKQMTQTKGVAAWFWGHEHTLASISPSRG